MWKSAKTIASTPSSAIIQLDVDDNFVVDTTHLNVIRKNKFDGYLRADPYDHIREFLAICNMFRYGKAQSEAVKNSMNSLDPSPSCRPTKVEVPKELPKVSMDIVNIVVNSSMNNASVNMHECKKCLELETELLNKKDFIKKETYDKLFRSYTTLEKHCISLEVDTQLNQEIFQRENYVSNQSASSFDQYIELNELKAQSQEKDMVISKLKERIKSLSGKMNKDKVKKDIKEIETINIDLDHRVSKLIAKNKHFKQTYKKLYEFDHSSSKDEFRKLNGKALVDNAITIHTIGPEMLKVDVEPLAPRLLNNKTVHFDYLKLTHEQAMILQEIVEQGKSQNPLNNSLDHACKYTKRIHELLILIKQTCPGINNSSDKLVVVTPKNKDKRVRFTEPVTSVTTVNF
nr:reverse transcriptase domain-containing protein [Tanacetum cinerariifolium]